MTTDNDYLPIPLYHGTSSLFLDSIIESDLGGKDPIAELGILDVAKEILPLVKEHIVEEDFAPKIMSFGRMVAQETGGMNFQHGDTYLSPSRSTAVGYIANEKYGSELLTYTLVFLEQLLRLNVEGVKGDLYREYPQVFNLLDVAAAPILIRIDQVAKSDLVAEDGSDATEGINRVIEIVEKMPDMVDVVLQQTNFRLRRPVPASELKIWFVNVTRWEPYFPDYILFPLDISARLVFKRSKLVT